MKYGKLISKLTKRSNNNGYVAVALVAGLAAGALLSILFAPESGEDTRRVIRDKAKGLGDNARDKFNALKNKFNGYDFEEQADKLEIEEALIKQKGLSEFGQQPFSSPGKPADSQPSVTKKEKPTQNTAKGT